MVCTADDFVGWKDFPKGLKVLLLSGDDVSAAEMRSKLEEMDYTVSLFSDEAEALSAISNDLEGFHVAIIEMSTQNSDVIFEFLETVKDLPIILVSNVHCLSTMMKSIALGASEFLQKPISDDKLRNIWQHVVHKAFNAGDKDVLEHLKHVLESKASVARVPLGSNKADHQATVKNQRLTPHYEEKDTMSVSDKYPAPSTPQLKHGERSFDKSDCHYEAYSSAEHESGEQDGNCKSVETTSLNFISESTALSNRLPLEAAIKVEHEPSVGFRSETITSSCSKSNDPPNYSASNDGGAKTAPARQDSCVMRANKKKTKVDWNPELHKKFVQAVEKLGVDQAIPSRILELMKVEGLTRHNVASHLQKYRLSRRHILPKEDPNPWPHLVDIAKRNYYPQKPVMAFPPYYPSHNLSAGQIHPACAPPGNYSSGFPMWGSTCYPAWQMPSVSWSRKPYPVIHADVWGCPVFPAPQVPLHPPDCFSPQNQCRGSTRVTLSDLHPAEDEVDKVVKEAISKPWLPLPLGLKPPSTDSVLDELSRQGVSPVPHNKGPHIC